MAPTRGFYSVAQYFPHPGRAEAANVGVVLFVPSDQEAPVRVRMSPTLARVRRMFAPTPADLRRITSGVEALTFRLTLDPTEFAAEADLAQFAAARADPVRITPPLMAGIEDPAAVLNALYDELVGDPDPAARGDRVTTPAGADAFAAEVERTAH